MFTIEREIHIDAPPAVVLGELQASRWRAAIDIAPEGMGARVRMTAAATPEPVAAALEMAMLDDVCAVKRRLEVADGSGQRAAVGKSM